MSRGILTVVCSVLACQLSVPVVALAQARLVRAAKLVSIDETWNLSLRVRGERRQVAARDLVFWGAFREGSGTSQVILSDGGCLSAELVAINASRVSVSTEIWGPVEVPRRAARGVIINLPPDPADRDRLRRMIQGSQVASDVLILRNSDQLRGTVSAGTEEHLSHLLFHPERSDAPLRLDLSQVVGIVFAGTPEAPQQLEPRVEIGWRDGSLLRVQQLRFAEEDGHQVVEALAPSGVSVRCRAELMWDAVKWIQPLGFGQLSYASDQEPTSFRQIPFLDLKRTWQPDRNVLGGGLRSDGVLFSKGIGMAPAARLTFVLPENTQKFEAELAVDDQAGDGGSVLFQVFAGVADEATGGISWDLRYESPIIRGGMPPTPISIGVANALRLALVVDFADRGDELDYANWLNARFLVRSVDP